MVKIVLFKNFQIYHEKMILLTVIALFFLTIYNCATSANGERLQVVDITDPTALKIVSSVDMPGTALDVYMSDNYMV